MNRYGRPGYVGGASSTKASANTICQKCLKKGHYSFECKAPSQERPYISRPSRSQQLLNPKLKPKLANIAPEPSAQEKAIAPPRAKDAHHTQRKRSIDDMDNNAASRKRTRSESVSSYSSASVATISTRSPSPDRHGRRPSGNRYHSSHRPQTDGQARGGAGDKRRRGSSSVSPSEGSSHDGRERNTRLRRSSMSPDQRGRRRSRSATSNTHINLAMDKSRRLDPDDRPKRESRADRVTTGYDPQYDPDREMKDVPNTESRPRSLSPYSQRVALTQGSLR